MKAASLLFLQYHNPRYLARAAFRTPAMIHDFSLFDIYSLDSKSQKCFCWLRVPLDAPAKQKCTLRTYAERIVWAWGIFVFHCGITSFAAYMSLRALRSGVPRQLKKYNDFCLYQDRQYTYCQTRKDISLDVRRKHA